jgi:hypothetical protein
LPKTTTEPNCHPQMTQINLCNLWMAVTLSQ